MAQGNIGIAFGVNSAFVEDTTKEAVMDSLLTFFSFNDGQPQPEKLTAWGYSQSQIDPRNPSIITSFVSIIPGTGAEYPQADFYFTTTLNETVGEFKTYHNFSAGDGAITRTPPPEDKQISLVPNGVLGVVIKLFGRTPENPPVWFIEIDRRYFSLSTAVGSRRVSLAIKLTLSDDSYVTVKKSVENGSQAYFYTKTF